MREKEAPGAEPGKEVTREASNYVHPLHRRGRLLRRGIPSDLNDRQKGLPAYLLRTQFENALTEIGAQKDRYVPRPGKDFCRDRKLSFEETMRFICCMYGGTINHELINYFPSDARPSKTAFIKRRKLISPDAFRDLFDGFNTLTPEWDKKDYRGYRLLAVDGSGIRVAHDPSSRTYQPGGPYKGLNLINLVAMYDLRNKVYLDYVTQARQDQDERAAAQEMFARMDKSRRSIAIMDRGFDGYYNIEYMNRLENTDYIIRSQCSMKVIRDMPMEEIDRWVEVNVTTGRTKKDMADYREGKVMLTSGPSRFESHKGKTVRWYFEDKCTVRFRVVRFQLDTGEYETLVTSLPQDEFPIRDLKHLYHMRWGIETSFRDLKMNLGIEKLHTKDETLVLQEIAARMMMFNFCMRVILNTCPEVWKGPKWQSQPAMSDCIYLCREWLWDNEPPPDEPTFRRYKEPIRPGRRDKRNIKFKAFAYFTYRTAA